MVDGRRRERLRFSKIYSFSCGETSFQDDHSHIGGPGFSRKAFINNPDGFEARNLHYGSNYVSTTKYNMVTFFPKSLFEQFRRVANVYFLVSAFLSFTKLGPFSAASVIVPLLVVIGATMAKEAIEDWGRFQQDNEVNNRKIKVHRGDGSFYNTESKSLRVGDVVRVEKDNFFPADLLLLSSCYEDGICYVETMNLDRETNLKVKQALEVTSSFQDDSNFRNLTAVVRCEDPNANLYNFVGTMSYGEEGHRYPLSVQQLLIKDSKLRNTDYVYGAIIFSGHDSKVMQNAMDPPSKRSKIERRMDRVIHILLSLLVLISAIGSVFFGITTDWDVNDDGRSRRWYLRPDHTTIYFNPERAVVAGIYHFLSAMILYGYFIPISLYVSIEIVKILQSVFINQDIAMYHEDTDKPAHARTSNLNEELGQVNMILSDKTGTLTSNSMEFIKCSIAGTAYGRGITEVERALTKIRASPLHPNLDTEHRHGEDGDEGTSLPAIKGFNFTDERIVDGNWVNEPHPDVIQMFFRVLATCHTAIPDIDGDSGEVTYEAESPDESAFVERSYKLLNVLEFNSARRRMSVIVRNNEGKLLLLCKGADSVVLERLAEHGRLFEAETRKHIEEYADAGLRTLVLAYREVDEEEHTNFNTIFMDARNSVNEDREEKIELAAELMERDLILLGATAVEDKLQNGVPECIDNLAQAGIKIWVLTGDKMETAVNIGFACSLLREGMRQIVVTLDTPQIKLLEKEGDKESVITASMASVDHQVREGRETLASSSTGIFALIIDGKSLEYALKDGVKNSFLNLAIACASVICCRSSPMQKALVTRLVKTGIHKTVLAIGDGANDVGMLQEADIGIGISGVEGMQAVMASDVAIARFRFLERLLLVHGHWCYRRISSMICYFFYKNIAFGFTLFLFEAYASFSGQSAYNDWFLSLYNVFFTSLPVIALGVFDQDVSARYCLKFPLLYQEGVQNVLFSWVRILGWMFNGILNAFMIFFLCTYTLETQAFRTSGETMDLKILGITMYSCIIWVVNCQMALFIRYFTMIQHIFIWGGITLWYLFLLALGAITPTVSTTGFMVFLEECSTAGLFWLVTFFVVITTLVPYYAHSAIQMWIAPMYHETIQWLRYNGQSEDPGYWHSVRQLSIRRTKVGCSARREAIFNNGVVKHRVFHEGG